MSEEVRTIEKGYYTDSAYFGYIHGKYQKYACESDYLEDVRKTDSESQMEERKAS